MASEAFTLAILLTLKDGASGGLDRFEARMRAAGKTGEGFLKQYEQIREDLSKDLAIGGVGIAGLKILKDGIQAAGDYQSVMTDLRSSLAQTGADGQINLNKLATEMAGAEAVAVRLGNKLPGTTADFAQMMQAMKQNGLDTKTIIDGAADAVGNLAVANNMKPVDLAGDFARYGNLFKLRPEDFTPAADVMSRIYSSTGQTTAELIEAAKYFQGRAGQGLGIGGLQHAEKYTRLFGFLGKQGMSGSMAGMGLTNFFTAYNQHKDKLDDLQKATGIKLDFFDKKGKFVGLDAVMDQMAQFDKLSAKDRTQWMDEIFGTLGAGVGNVMIDTKGWKQFNEEQNKTISLQDKTALKAKDYNMQMEALGGTLTNLKVAIFEPMIPGATAAIEKANELVGVLQGFAKAHPDVAKYAVTFFGIGSAALVAYSGIKTVTSGVQMLKLASAFRRGEGLPGLLDQTAAATERVSRTQAGFVRQGDTVAGTFVKQGNAAKTAAKGVDGLASSTVIADSKTAGLRKNLFSLNNVFKVTLLLETAGFTWDQIKQLRETAAYWTNLNKDLDKQGSQSFSLYQQTPTASRNPKAEASSMTSLLQMRNDNVQKNLDPSRRNVFDIGADFGKILTGKDIVWDTPIAPGNPLLSRRKEREDYYSSQPTRSSQWGAVEYTAAALLPAIVPVLTGTRISPQQLADREIRGANYLQQRAPSLADPQVMRSFRTEEMPKMNLTPQMSQDLNNMLKMAFPDSFAQSMTSNIQSMTDGISQSLSSLQQPIAGTAELFSGLPPSITPVSQAFATLPQPLTDAGNAFTTLPQPINDTTGAFGNLLMPAGRIPGSFNNVFTSANQLALGLDGVSAKIANWQPPATPSVGGAAPAPSGGSPRPQPTIPSMFGMPGRAIGGVVERDGMAYVHAGNVITPAAITRGLPGFEQVMSLARQNGGVNTVSDVLRTYSQMNAERESIVTPFEQRSQNTIVNSDSLRTTNDHRSVVRSFPMPSTSNVGNTATFALAVPKREASNGSSPAVMPANVKPAIQTFSTVRTDPSFRLSAGDDRRLGNPSSLLDLTRRTDDRRSDFSSIANVSNLRSESRNDSRRSESRFNFDERLLERADRAANVASGVSNISSSEGAVTINAPLTLNITAGSGGVKETEAVVKKALEQHVKKIEATVNEQMAAKRLDRRLARFSDNGRLRM